MTNLPLNGQIAVTAAYGQKGSMDLWRPDGVHKGIDLISRENKDDIYSTCDGTVRVVAWDAEGWGQYVSIGDAQGRKHIFAHMVQGSVKLKAGDSVTRSTVIGLMGNTGRSTGKHLHYQINDSDDKPVDPTAWLHIPNMTGNYSSADYQVDASGELTGKSTAPVPAPQPQPEKKTVTWAEAGEILRKAGYTGVEL